VDQKISHLLDLISGFFAIRKGLLPLIAIFMILLNFFLNFIAPNWFSQSDFFLHLGIILAILGILLAWAL